MRLNQLTEDDRRKMLGEEIAEIDSEAKRLSEELGGMKRKLLSGKSDFNDVRQERNYLIRQLAKLKEDQ